MARARTATPPPEQPTESEQRELEEDARSEPITREAREAVEALLSVTDERTVFERMVAIVGELPAIGKESENTQQKFKYRGHDDVMNALNPLLSKHGVFMVPNVKERITDQRPTRSGGVMYEVNLLVEYTFYGARGDSIVAAAWGEGTDSGDKATNKAMTMAFKNVIAQSFAVSTEEYSRYDTDQHTDEATTGRSSAERREVAVDHENKPPPNWSEALRRFDAIVGQNGEAAAWLEELIMKRWGVMSLNDLDSEQRRQAFVGFASAMMLLEDKFGDLSLTDGQRAIVIAAFATKNDGIQLEGPAWALDGKEAEAGRPARDAPKPESAEQAEGAEQAPAEAAATE